MSEVLTRRTGWHTPELAPRSFAARIAHAGLLLGDFSLVQKRCRDEGLMSVMCVPSLRVIAEPHALNRIASFLDEFWASHPRVPATTQCRFGIAIGEIAANIVKHATKGIDRPVDLQMWAVVRIDDVLVTLADDGIAAPEGLLTREMPQALEESGRGIPLARATLSSLQYRRKNELNVWTLISESF